MKQKYDFSVSWWWAGLVFFVFGFYFIGKPRATVSVPTAPVNDARWDEMVAHMQETAAQYKGDVGIYVKNLKTGRLFEYNTDHTFVTASLIKVPIMVAAFQAIHEGRFTLNTRIQYKRSYRRDGSGTLKWSRPGAYYPLSYLIYQMITKSDNTATAMLIDLMGYDYLNEKFAEMGLKATRIAPTGMSLADRLADPALDNYTTPTEFAALLERIYKRQVVSDGLSDLMLEIMKGANSRTRLAKTLPREWQLARKTGLLRKNCHDVGIVFSPEGDYVLCVFTNSNSANYRVAKGLISTVGKQAYDYIEEAI
jgi:beta-lactamase class A